MEISAFIGRIKLLTLPGTEDRDLFYLLPPKAKESWHLSPSRNTVFLDTSLCFSYPISAVMAIRIHPESYPSESQRGLATLAS